MANSFSFPYGSRSRSIEHSDKPALDIRNLSVVYPSSDQELALENVTLCLPTGTRLALVGPNGAGKSTLLKAIAGLLPIHSGEISVFGQPIVNCRQRVAYLPQRGDIDWRFPVSLRKLVLAGRYVHMGWFKRPHQIRSQNCRSND
jgi:ABC-type Mn2+/Zn2+ transport system ATPase subunit